MVVSCIVFVVLFVTHGPLLRSFSVIRLPVVSLVFAVIWTFTMAVVMTLNEVVSEDLCVIWINALGEGSHPT